MGRSKAVRIKRRDFADKLCLQMQTKGARFADKVCLKMQTNFADKPLQDTPPQNADKLLQKSRRAHWRFWQIADKLCRQWLSATRVGTPAFLFVYTTLQGLSTVKCRQSLSTAVYSKMQTKFVYSTAQRFFWGSWNLFTVS